MASEPLHLFSQLNTTLRCCIVGSNVKTVEITRSHSYQKALYTQTCIPTTTPENHQYFIIIR
ncbi:hypothetical protein K445DRAFT_316015 [Daldinia sp. EC12]|nr:hypothetical protein K445DRAFT_319336 [Daldinia sp. EC12]OTB17379.1 hypothetical protein K445DRAFT_316015 [Daldinia sp. EC12]